eukprot:6184239-Pleurochrysis_carterae.AAC.3
MRGRGGVQSCGRGGELGKESDGDGSISGRRRVKGWWAARKNGTWVMVNSADFAVSSSLHLSLGLEGCVDENCILWRADLKTSRRVDYGRRVGNLDLGVRDPVETNDGERVKAGK